MALNVPLFHTLVLQPEHASAICEWSYPAPYNIYGWLSWDQMQALEIEFGNPQIREEQYIAVLDKTEELIGFAQLFPMEQVTRLGLGMRPDRCGRGLGKSFVEAVVAEARNRRPSDQIDLEVLCWNERAIRAYSKAGFQITDKYEKLTPSGEQSFYCMVHTP